MEKKAAMQLMFDINKNHKSFREKYYSIKN